MKEPTLALPVVDDWEPEEVEVAEAVYNARIGLDMVVGLGGLKQHTN